MVVVDLVGDEIIEGSSFFLGYVKVYEVGFGEGAGGEVGIGWAVGVVCF